MRRSLCQDPLCVIPALLGSDTGQVPGSDRADSFWVVAEEAPGALTGVEDVVVGVPDAGTEQVLAQVSPAVLHGFRQGERGGREKHVRRLWVGKIRTIEIHRGQERTNKLRTRE